MIRMKVAGCFMEYNGKFIALLRRPDKPDGGTWGLPAGKIKDGEAEDEAVLREVMEETGYKADRGDLEFLGRYDFNFPDLFLEFFAYRLALHRLIRVSHNFDEHTKWKWVSPKECRAMPNLIRGFRDLLEKI